MGTISLRNVHDSAAVLLGPLLSLQRVTRCPRTCFSDLGLFDVEAFSSTIRHDRPMAARGPVPSRLTGTLMGLSPSHGFFVLLLDSLDHRS